MNPTDRTNRVAVVAGVVLVAIGVSALVNDVAWPLFEPLREGIALVGSVAWPLVLVLAGVALLARARNGGEIRLGSITLRRSRTDRVATGLLGGIAEATGVPSGIVRALFIVLLVLGGGLGAVLLYLVGTWLVPEGPAVVTAAGSSPYGAAAPAPPAPPVV